MVSNHSHGTATTTGNQTPNGVKKNELISCYRESNHTGYTVQNIFPDKPPESGMLQIISSLYS